MSTRFSFENIGTYCSFDQMSQIFSKQPDSTPNLQTIYNSNTNIHLSTNVSVKAYIISNGNVDIRTILTNM